MKDKLFHLVESLSFGEIQHFRESARRRRTDGSARYLQLFEEILENVRDGAANRLEAVSQDVGLRVLRHRLFYNLLGSLETFPDYRQAKGGLHSVIRQIEILNSKGIHAPIQRLFEDGVKTGREIEDFKGLLALYDLYMEIVFESASIANLQGDHLSRLAAERQEIKSLENDLDTFRMLRASIYGTAGESFANIIELSEKTLAHPALQAAILDGYRSHSAELLSLQIQFHAKRMAGQFAETAAILDRGIAIFAANPGLLRDHTSIRLHLGLFVYNRGLLAAYQGDSVTARQMAKQLAHSKGQEILLFERLPALNLQIAILDKDWSMAEAVIAEIQAGLIVHRGKITPKRERTYAYQVAHFYLAFGKPQAALPFILQLIEADPDEGQTYINQFGWIMLLIAHCDLGNYDLVIDRLRATKGFLRKHGALNEFETVVIRGIKHIAKAGDTPQRGEALDGFEAALLDLATTPEYSVKKNYFDFPCWITAKRTGTTILECGGINHP